MKCAFAIAFFCGLHSVLFAAFPTHTLNVGSTNYQVTASKKKVHKEEHYILKITAGGTDTTTLDLGSIADWDALQKVLTEKLHKGNLFALPTPWPAASTPGTAYGNVDQLIKDLVQERFPLSNIPLVAEQPIDDNNILRLVQRKDNARYQLSIFTPGAETSLVRFSLVAPPAPAPPPPSLPAYLVDWGALTASVLICDHFDQFLQLYYKMPATTVKPALFVQFRSTTNDYELAYSWDGHKGFLTGVILSKSVGASVAGDAYDKLTVAGNQPALSKVINPYAPKKAKDEPKFKEDQ